MKLRILYWGYVLLLTACSGGGIVHGDQKRPPQAGDELIPDEGAPKRKASTTYRFNNGMITVPDGNSPAKPDTAY